MNTKEILFIIGLIIFATYTPVVYALIFNCRRKSIDLGNPIVIAFTCLPIINHLYLILLIITGKFYGMSSIPKFFKELWK